MLQCEIPVVDGMAAMRAVKFSRMGGDGVLRQLSLGRKDDRWASRKQLLPSLARTTSPRPRYS